MTVICPSPESILSLTKKLCSIPSVSGCAEEENRVAQVLYKTLAEIQPTQENTLNTEIFDCEGDRLGRQAVWALLRPVKKTERTVLLTGHFDVVDVQGPLADLAFSPDAYTEALADIDLPDDVREDLESGNWLFGRGVMDMKSGLAIFIETMRVLARSPDLRINIAFLAVPDEESDSAGMRGSLTKLCTIRDEQMLDFVAALTGEPCFWTEGQAPARPYYTGTTGKIMPYFLCVGQASHVNDYVEGANAALIAADVVRLMEGNKSFICGKGSDTLPPPTCLNCQTRVATYSVSLPAKAVCYFNVLTDHATPAGILNGLKDIANEALLDSCKQMHKTALELALKGADVAITRKKGHVLTYKELMETAEQKLGGNQEFARQQKAFLQTLDPKTDMREAAIRISEWVWEISGFQGPAIVLGFLPPYYPSRFNRGREAKERMLKRIIREQAVRGGALAGDGAVTIQKVFGGITDLSYLGFQGLKSGLSALKDNMPGWGELYSLPMKELLSLDVPIANMGPAGKDAHKATERLELNYSLKIAPQLLLETIEKLSFKCDATRDKH